ncbi:MAG: hypothetical protein U0587_03685 [Candidatus Binatia bacterium]
MQRQFVCTAVAVSISGTGDAAGQLRIDYQARLTDASGIPANGSFDLRFRVTDDRGVSYPVESPWSEAHEAVRADNGFVRIVLGTRAPFPEDLFERGPLDEQPRPVRFVEVSIAEREEAAISAARG